MTAAQTTFSYDRVGMRRYFHGVLVKGMAEFTGYSEPECKAYLTERFCPLQLDERGREMEKSTERLPNPQFAAFNRACEAFLAVDVGIQFSERAAP